MKPQKHRARVRIRLCNNEILYFCCVRLLFVLNMQDRQEDFVLEINGVLGDISLALNNLDKWMATTHVDGGMLHKFNQATIQPEPYG